MKSKQPEQKKPSDLRKRAEENLRTQITPPGAMSDKEASRLIHELQVHQSELEMQNEELRKAQSEIEESRTRYSDLYDFAPVGYFTFDKHGLILEANLAAATELGIERSRLINKPFRAYIVTEDKTIFDQHFQNILKSYDRQTCEIRLKRKDGSEFYAQLESIAAEDLKGNSLCRTSVSNITLRKHAEEALRKTYDELELRVKERTKDLAEANEQLLREIEERKRAAEALRESEERYSTMVNSSPNLVFILKNRIIQYINEFGLRMMGYQKDEIIGKSMFDFISDDSKELAVKNMQRRLAGEHVENYEVKAFTKSQDIKYFLVSAAVIPYEQGNAFLAVLSDITERKKTEKALRQSEERYRKQFEEAIDAIFLADLGTGIIVDCNIAASKLIEREKSEIIGEHQSFLHPAEEIKDGFSETFKSHMTGESSELLEDRVITKSRQIKYVAIRASKITIEGKEVMQGIFRDITERKGAEEALRESEDRYSTMVNFSPNVVLVHKGGTIHYINESGIRILGYLRDEIIGKTVLEFISDDSKELVAKNMQRRISGEHVENYEVKVITKSKDIKYFLVNAAIIPYENEKASLVVLFDITERKQAEEKIGQKMSEMERLKKRFYM